MINSQDIKKGTCIRLDGKLYFCVDFLHVILFGNRLQISLICRGGIRAKYDPGSSPG